MGRPFANSDSTHQRGRRAEKAGERWLADQGYRIVARNYRTPVGEIDLIAQDGDTLCFIEIKARTSSAYGPAITAISPHQQSRVARAASLYLLRAGWEGPCRFDALGLDWAGEKWTFTLLRSAFEAG